MTSQSSKSRHGHGAHVADAIQTAAEYAIDVSQLRDNLALTIAQRFRRHQTAFDTVEMLRKAGRP